MEQKCLGDDILIIFQWLNNQLLKMQWLSDIVTFLVKDVFGLDVKSRVGGSIHFFIYDYVIYSFLKKE
jgi:uncharacterized protein